MPRKGPGRSRVPSRVRIGMLAVALAATLLSPGPVEGQAPAEYELKAAFLYNFARFVEWPPETFGGSDAPFILGVAGDDAFGSILDQLVREKTARGRRVEVKRFRRPEQLSFCHILFVSPSVEGAFLPALERSGSHGVLIVGELESFARRGGTVALFIEDSRVKVAINAERARRAGLQVGAQLMSVARLVRDDAAKER